MEKGDRAEWLSRTRLFHYVATGRAGLGGVWVAAPRKESRPRRTSPEEEGSASPCRGGNAAHEKERKTVACSAVHFSRDAGGQCSVSRRPWQVLTVKRERERRGQSCPTIRGGGGCEASGIPVSSPLYSHVTRRAGGTRETRKGHVSAANFPAQWCNERAARASAAGRNFGGARGPPGRLHLQVNRLASGKIPPP